MEERYRVVEKMLISQSDAFDGTCICESDETRVRSDIIRNSVYIGIRLPQSMIYSIACLEEHQDFGEVKVVDDALTLVRSLQYPLS